MPNSETISVDGVNLKTLAKNIETLAATLRTPPIRTDNVPVPGRHGRVRTTRKMFDENILAWPMWVIGCADDGTIPVGSTERKTFYANVDALTRLFGRHTVAPLDVRHTLPDGSTRQALAEVTDLIDFSTFGDPPTGKFSVALRMHEAFFRDILPVTSVVTLASGATGVPVNHNGGSAPITDMVITLPGPATNPTWVNPDTGDYVQFAGVVPNGQSLVIDCGAWTATLNGASVMKSILYSGSALFTLTPDVSGVHHIQFVQTGGTAGPWSTTIAARRRYLVG